MKSRKRIPMCWNFSIRCSTRDTMEDGEGREIDFKNTIIILTTNAGTDTMAKLCADPETMPEPRGSGRRR